MKWHSYENYVAVLCYECGQYRFLSDFPAGQHKCYSCLVKEKLGQKLLDVTVRPKRYPLTGDGTWWEFGLMAKGFNELPRIQQYGVLDNAYSTGEVKVYWPHVDIETFVFPDEIEFPWEED